MPPQNNDSDRGWKAFFSLLMILQVVGVAIMWRTYDAIRDTGRKADKTELQVEQVIYPKLQDHEERIRKLEPSKGG
jgi:hypothetical protein